MPRRASVATESSAERRSRIALLTVEERVARTFELGRRDLALYASANGLDGETARRTLQRRRQSRRRPSACIEALLR
jgi:hypothetical protein